jgi:hypothetical protein
VPARLQSLLLLLLLVALTSQRTVLLPTLSLSASRLTMPQAYGWPLLSLQLCVFSGASTPYRRILSLPETKHSIAHHNTAHL